ncbi:MAG: hypothetical protein KGJ78_10700 [Alphaproteobacteria bacterium]|nr:hypothetical protein [Alphaproteobacteria bacterium]
MIRTTERKEFVARAIDTASRVAREGGVGHVQLPHPETGQLAVFEVNQESAHEILCALLDRLASDLWNQIADGCSLPLQDREFLRVWTAVTIAESEDAEQERRTESSARRSHLYVIQGDKQ